MPFFLALLSFLFQFMTTADRPSDSGQRIAAKHLPVVVTDNAGTGPLVHGQDSTIYYAILRLTAA